MRPLPIAHALFGLAVVAPLFPRAKKLRLRSEAGTPCSGSGGSDSPNATREHATARTVNILQPDGNNFTLTFDNPRPTVAEVKARVAEQCRSSFPTDNFV